MTKRSRASLSLEPLKPAAEGMDLSEFSKFRDAVKLETETLGSLAGAAHMVLQRGTCVFSCSGGWADRRKRVKFGLDTICRLHGNTKPLVAAAFFTLVDSGTVKLTDPISKYVPFAEDVAVGKEHRTKRATTRPTLRHLLTMTAGLRYEDCPAYKDVMKRIRTGEISDLGGLCKAIAKVPLQSHPGKRYEYSFCTDMLGFLCETVSGLDLEAFVTKVLLRPLGMKDTYFIVPAAKRNRLSKMYDCKPLSRKKQRPGGLLFVPEVWDHKLSAPGIKSAGGGILSYKDPGMLSTVRDYVRFVYMLSNDGVDANGRRILQASTVKMLWRDGLQQYGREDGRLPGWNDADGPRSKGGHWDHTGWSLLNTHLSFDRLPSRAAPARAGHTMWMGGGGGTYWSIDARRKLVLLSFTQSFGGRDNEGHDVTPFAIAAVDNGASAAKRRRTD